MPTKVIGQSALEAWVDRLIAHHRVFGVQAKGDRFAYASLLNAADLRLDFDVTILPPKKYLQPMFETILRYHADGHYTSVVEHEPFILFGIHPYDVAAIAQMDTVFRTDCYDTHYMARRQAATIVACDIQRLSPGIFAASMEAATVQEGFDILLTRLGEQYLVEIHTEKGAALLDELGDAPDADPLLLTRRDQFWDDARRFFARDYLKCRLEEIPARLETAYDHPVWERYAARCYSCGSCNLVCPTCFCFDLQDALDWSLASGERFRCWDACLLRGFAEVAGGFDFRRRREERYRHRFYRKGKYLWDRYHFIACVGCGRCVTACTTRIASPVEIYNRLLEDRA